MGTLRGLRAGAGLGDTSRAAEPLLKAGLGRVVEAPAGGPGGPEHGVGQHSHQHQRTRAEDGGGSCTCLYLEKQQGIDGQRWERKELV